MHKVGRTSVGAIGCTPDLLLWVIPPLFKASAQVRKVIYTTNEIKSLNKRRGVISQHNLMYNILSKSSSFFYYHYRY